MRRKVEREWGKGSAGVLGVLDGPLPRLDARAKQRSAVWPLWGAVACAVARGTGPAPEEFQPAAAWPGRTTSLLQQDPGDLLAQPPSRGPGWGSAPGCGAVWSRGSYPLRESEVLPPWRVDVQARGLNHWVTLAGPIWLGRRDAQVRSPHRRPPLEAWPEPQGLWLPPAPPCSALTWAWSPWLGLQGPARARGFLPAFIRFTYLR